MLNGILYEGTGITRGLLLREIYLGKIDIRITAWSH